MDPVARDLLAGNGGRAGKMVAPREGRDVYPTSIGIETPEAEIVDLVFRSDTPYVKTTIHLTREIAYELGQKLIARHVVVASPLDLPKG